MEKVPVFSYERVFSFSLILSALDLHCGAWVSLVVACELSCSEAYGILVPQPGIEPTCPALEG